jgi:transcriptional regulator with XRE-family HTH domain
VESGQSAGRYLRELREARRQSLRAAAAGLGIAASHLSRIERGERHPGREMSERIATYYGIDTDTVQLAEGHVPISIARILLEHPEELARLRRLYPPEQ